MRCVYLLSLVVFSTLTVRADVAVAPVELPPVTVYSPLVANQEPVSSFATPVTALRYEPLVDVLGRNFAEIQADVTIRGGTFENTGFSLGALPIYDPQTGHYFAELPFAPAMLSAPGVRTGADNTISGWGGTAGSIAYGWQPVRTGGFVSAGAGDNELLRGEVYSGYKSDRKLAGRTLAADAAVSYSNSNGSRDGGYHDFSRYSARVQLADDTSQTDVFAGFQTKNFGWPNLYAGRLSLPAPRREREDLETSLVGVNHRVTFGADGDYFQAGAYLRRNEDHYSIPSIGANSFHVTDVGGAGLDGRVSVSDSTAIRYRAGAIGDELGSSSLIVGPVNGRYNDRTQYYTGLFADHTLELGAERDLVLTGGANYDGSNRAGGEVSPVVEVALLSSKSAVRRVYVSYAESSQLPTYTSLNNTNFPAPGLFNGNRNLGRSTAQNIELGAELAASEWTLKTAVFYRYDDNLVDWVFDPTLPASNRRAVAVDLDTYGFESVARRSWSMIDVVFGYTWIDKTDDYTSPTTASFYALDYAEHRLTAAIVARLGAGLEVRMDNEARIQAENALRRRNDEVILSSLGLYYAVPSVKGLTLSAQVDNLWNTYYEEVPLVPGSRREFSVGARYAW